MTCPHTHSRYVPDFPGSKLVCLDCGAELPLPGFVGGVRDFYLQGDPAWRRSVEVLKREWASGRLSEDILQCPSCCFVGTLDDFDCLGADGDNVFCNQCHHEFDWEPCDTTRRASVGQLPLFTESDE